MCTSALEEKNKSGEVFLNTLIQDNLRCAIKFYTIIPEHNFNDPPNPKYYTRKLDLRGINAGKFLVTPSKHCRLNKVGLVRKRLLPCFRDLLLLFTRIRITYTTLMVVNRKIVGLTLVQLKTTVVYNITLTKT